MDSRSPARDPRLKARTPSTLAGNITDSALGRPVINGEPWRGEEAEMAASTPPSTTSRLPGVSVVLDGWQGLHEAVSRHVRNAVNVDFVGRDLRYLKEDRERAQDEFEQVKHTKDKYPIIVKLASQKTKRMDDKYNLIKQEELGARAAEEDSVGILTTCLQEAINAKDEAMKDSFAQAKIFAEKLATVIRDLQEVRSLHNKTVVTQPPPLSEATRKRLTTQEQKTESVDKRHSKANEEMQRQIEQLRSEQRAVNRTATQAIDALRSENEKLRGRVEGLERRIPLLEAQLHDAQNLRAAEKEQQQRILDASVAQQQAFDNTERLRKTIHLKVETMNDKVSSMNKELGSVGSQISNLRADHSTLAEKYQSLQSSVATGGPESAALTTALHGEITSLKRADQDHTEKVAALDVSAEEISGKLTLLETQFLDFVSAGQTSNHTDLSRTIQSIESRLVENHAHCTKEKEADHAKFLSVEQRLTTHSADQRKLESEFTVYTNKRKSSETERDKLVINEVTKVQDKQTAIEATLSRLPAQGLSHEERQQLRDATNVALAVYNLEMHVTGLSKGIEKQAHMALGLNQRFNSLTTETLAKQVLTVGNKALPRFESRLLKVEGEMGQLRREVQKPATAEAITAEAQARFQSIEDNVESLSTLETRFQNKHDILARNFKLGRDELQARIGNVEESVNRQEATHSTYRASTANNMKVFETRLDSVNSRIDDTEARVEATKSQGSSSTDRNKPLLGSKGPSIHRDGALAAPTQPRRTSQATTPHSAPTLSGATNSNVGARISRTVHDSDEEEEEVDADDLLASFQSIPQAANSRPPPRKSRGGQGSSRRRKRSRSQENSQESEPSAFNNRPSKAVRR